MNTNIKYKNKYFKYKNKYIEYQNKYGGACIHDVLPEQQDVVFYDNFEELQNIDKEYLIEDVYYSYNNCNSLIAVISFINSCIPRALISGDIERPISQFPAKAIIVNHGELLIHDIWDSILTCNRLCLENVIKNKFAENLANNNTGSCFIYPINKLQYDFVFACLKILMYYDIHSYKSCLVANIPYLILNKLRIYVLGTYNGAVLYSYHEDVHGKLVNEVLVNSMSPTSHTNKVINKSMSGMDILKEVINVIYMIVVNRIIYKFEDQINLFTTRTIQNNLYTLNSEMESLLSLSQYKWCGRKILNNIDPESHLNIENLIDYISVTIYNDNSVHLNKIWPFNTIKLFNSISMHFMWTKIVEYNNVNRVFEYTKFIYDFIMYVLNISKKLNITSINSIKCITVPFTTTDITFIYGKYFHMANPNTDLETTKGILNLVMNLMYEIIYNAIDRHYKIRLFMYDIIPSDDNIFIGDIPKFIVEYTDHNINKINKSGIINEDTDIFNNLRNYLSNIFLISYKMNIIIEYIKYIDIYNIVPHDELVNITEYINLCKSPIINNVDDILMFIKNTTDFTNSIKHILDLFNIVICILLCTIKTYIPINSSAAINTSFYLYRKIHINMIKYYNTNIFTISELTQYILNNIDILLTVESLFLNIPNSIESINNTSNKSISKLLQLLLEEYKYSLDMNDDISFSNFDELQAFLNTTFKYGIELIITDNKFCKLDSELYTIMNSENVHTVIYNMLNIIKTSPYDKYKLINVIIFNMTNDYIKYGLFHNHDLLYKLNELYNSLIHVILNTSNSIFDSTSITNIDYVKFYHEIIIIFKNINILKRNKKLVNVPVERIDKRIKFIEQSIFLKREVHNIERNITKIQNIYSNQEVEQPQVLERDIRAAAAEKRITDNAAAAAGATGATEAISESGKIRAKIQANKLIKILKQSVTPATPAPETPAPETPAPAPAPATPAPATPAPATPAPATLEQQVQINDSADNNDVIKLLEVNERGIDRIKKYEIEINALAVFDAVELDRRLGITREVTTQPQPMTAILEHIEESQTTEQLERQLQRSRDAQASRDLLEQQEDQERSQRERENRENVQRLRQQREQREQQEQARDRALELERQRQAMQRRERQYRELEQLRQEQEQRAREQSDRRIREEEQWNQRHAEELETWNQEFQRWGDARPQENMSHEQSTHPNPWDMSAIVDTLRNTGVSESRPLQPLQPSQSSHSSDSSVDMLRMVGNSMPSVPRPPEYPPPASRQSVQTLPFLPELREPLQQPLQPPLQNLLNEREINLQLTIDGIRSNLNDTQANLGAINRPIQEFYGTSSSHRARPRQPNRLLNILSRGMYGRG